jgi:hypothetical protein
MFKIETRLAVTELTFQYLVELEWISRTSLSSALRHRYRTTREY